MNNQFGWCKTDDKTRELEIELGLYEIFEIHITGEKKVIEYFKTYNHPYLEISLLTPDTKNIGVDYMCAIKHEAKSFEDAEGYARMLYHVKN